MDNTWIISLKIKKFLYTEFILTFLTQERGFHSNKEPSIYDIHKKITFLTPLPPDHMRPHGPDPPPPCGRPHTVDMKYTPLS